MYCIRGLIVDASMSGLINPLQRDARVQLVEGDVPRQMLPTIWGQSIRLYHQLPAEQHETTQARMGIRLTGSAGELNISFYVFFLIQNHKIWLSKEVFNKVIWTEYLQERRDSIANALELCLSWFDLIWDNKSPGAPFTNALELCLSWFDLIWDNKSPGAPFTNMV